MSKLKRKVIEGLFTMNLCLKGREIFNDSTTAGEGPQELDRHRTECAQCDSAIDALVVKIADGLPDTE